MDVLVDIEVTEEGLLNEVVGVWEELAHLAHVLMPELAPDIGNGVALG